VTLGGVTWDKVKRHPTLDDNVVIGSGAKISVRSPSARGPRSAPTRWWSGSTAQRHGGRHPRPRGDGEKKADDARPDLEHGKLPDPEAKAISCLFDQIRALEKKVQDLTARLEENDKAAAEQTAKSSRSRKSA